MIRPRWQWALMAVLLGSALLVAGRGDPGPPTDAQRAHRIASELRCPTCQGLSVADSDAAAARALREEIQRRVAEGQSDNQVYAYVESRYGGDVRLAPPARGMGALVWVLPVVGAVVALAGLSVAFVRWRNRPDRPVTDEDRTLVEEALRS